MPLDVGETINHITDSILSAPIINTIAKNPIYTSIFIVFIIMLIILFVFRNIDSGLLTMTLRVCFWSFITVTGILMIHNKLLIVENNQNVKTAAYDSLFTERYMPNSVLSDVIVPIPVGPGVLPAAI
jgi:hypothetical protein